MLVLSDSDVRKHAVTWQIVEANKNAFVMLAQGKANVPKRLIMRFENAPDDASLFKPCSLDSGEFGLKMIHSRPGNAALGESTTPGTIMLFDRETGAPKCLMNATYLTALRTAAGSAVATAAMSRPESSVLVVFGAGVQGEAHVKTVWCVRPISQVIIVNRSLQRAKVLATALQSELASQPIDASGATRPAPQISVITSDDVDAVRAACEDADIVCTTTGAAEPLFEDAWLKSGAHVNAVGSFRRETTELPPALVARASPLVVDTADAWEAGDLADPLDQGMISKDMAITLGDLCQGVLAPSSSGSSGSSVSVSLFKSVGTAVQDIVSASQVYRDCLNLENVGTRVDI